MTRGTGYDSKCACLRLKLSHYHYLNKNGEEIYDCLRNNDIYYLDKPKPAVSSNLTKLIEFSLPTLYLHLSKVCLDSDNHSHEISSKICSKNASEVFFEHVILIFWGACLQTPLATVCLKPCPPSRSHPPISSVFHCLCSEKIIPYNFIIVIIVN